MEWQGREGLSLERTLGRMAASSAKQCCQGVRGICSERSMMMLQALDSARRAAEELVEPMEWQGREGLSLKRAQEAAGLAAIRQMLHSQGTALR